MLFTQKNSVEEVFQTVKHELHRGALDAKHPFRFVTLATQSENGVDARYVVLRTIDQEMNFFVFTDARSSKVAHLHTNPDMVLLFYHPHKRTQVKVKGKAEIISGGKTKAAFWSNIQGEAQKSYNQMLSPGTVIRDPSGAYSWNEPMTDSNFTVIQIRPFEIEALQLNGNEHLRILFSLEGNDWKKNWIAP
ncbi:pyridoxamine 5'-phosphate oxidase family protein [Aquiflexum sp. TKW24L]|uniref:pyridoxamine 5'-phosphate oxidase family protein n=1 Tax=Aquiflexum sp. TKW24L TaxID=2942212 RepID=UPI0020BEE4A0|nr:pyridoxamine 5'-phosphate oxidase family protein [Aquiflexum sp. TKW24L]MCL6258606.1 pyridoxamine 5'-phosphate oxidase family protein [Aquiflexum sp. TKW24L]